MRIRHWLPPSLRIDRGNISSSPAPADESSVTASPVQFLADLISRSLGARYRWTAFLIGMSCVTLVLLAYFQVVWIGQVRNTQHETMLNSLRNSMRLFESSCQRELSQFLTAFQAGLPTEAGAGTERNLHRYRYWRQSFHHSAVVDRVLVYESPSPGEGQLLELNLGKRRFEPANWSGHLIDLRYRLNEPVLRSAANEGQTGDPTWVLYMDSAALVRAIPARDRDRAISGGAESSEAAAFLFILLNIHYLSEHMLPEMVDQYFTGPDGEKQYDVAVLADGGPYFLYRVPRNRRAVSPRDIVAEGGKYFLYRSGKRIDGSWLEGADSRRRLTAQSHTQHATTTPFAPDWNVASSPAATGFANGSFSLSEGTAEPGDSVVYSHGRPVPGLDRGAPARVVLADGGSLTVEIVAKHVSGSLERVVLRQQRIDLAIVLGVLVVLAVAMTLVVVASSQAARLAQIRMDFVAGVSHELRTPLSAIRTMGENMADGVVVSERKVERYGELIRDYARRLMEMVEDTLLLSAIGAGKRPLQLAEVDVAAVVREVVAHMRPMIDRS